MDVPLHADAPARPTSLLGRRRVFLVNPRYQLRGAAIALSIAMLLLVALNIAFYTWASSNSAAAAASAPELADVFRAQDRTQLALIGIASVIFLGGVFAVSILESHRTAGAAYHLERCLRDVRDGCYASRVTLRRGDHLRELENAFNQMTQSLRSEALHDIDTLEAAIAAIGGTGDASLIEPADALRALAREKRRHLR